MLTLLTTEVFADWFSALSDRDAEDVATTLEVIESLGPAKAPPSSRESLLWYEHPSVSRFGELDSFAWDLEGWAAFHDYSKRVREKLESPWFIARLARLGAKESAAVLDAVKAIKGATDPRYWWRLRLIGDPRGALSRPRPDDACAELRRLYFEALEAAGFALTDVSAHTSALREVSRRAPGKPFRLLYGVSVERETALIVLGEWLDRTFYGDSVRVAERLWKQFSSGELGTVEPVQLR